MARVWMVLISVALACFADTLRAQPGADARVRIEAGANSPISGALVALVDAKGNVKAESLSNSSGRVTLPAVAGEYRVRVRRIGFLPFLSDPVSFPTPQELLLRVESPRVVLTDIVVTANAQCGRNNRDAATLSILWEEVSKALRSSQLQIGDIPMIGSSTTYVREIGPNGAVVYADTTVRPPSNRRPFVAVDPESLVKSGYVTGNERDGWEYFGPDEAVLLSAGFSRTHCFAVVRDRQRKGEIGVAFQPAPGDRTANIKGVLWIDEETSELREITFNYVNAGVLTQFKPGGFTRFRRMPSGAWIVSEWILRMPKLEIRRQGIVSIGHRETGGHLVPSTPPPY